jgi:hypothetical protein
MFFWLPKRLLKIARREDLKEMDAEELKGVDAEVGF